MSGAELCPNCPVKSGQDQLIADDPQTNELNKCLLLYATEHKIGVVCYAAIANDNGPLKPGKRALGVRTSILRKERLTFTGGII